MADFASAAAFARELERLDRTMEREIRSATRDMAEKGQRVAEQEAARDLGGDTRFSGWTPGPDLREMRIRRAGDSHILHPTRQSAGGWTVAQRGRNRGQTGGFQGPGVNRRTGQTSRTRAGNVRKVRAFTAKRWNGVTAGKGTADRATARFEREVAPIADKAIRTAVVKHFDVN